MAQQRPTDDQPCCKSLVGMVLCIANDDDSDLAAVDDWSLRDYAEEEEYVQQRPVLGNSRMTTAQMNSMDLRTAELVQEEEMIQLAMEQSLQDATTTTTSSHADVRGFESVGVVEEKSCNSVSKRQRGGGSVHSSTDRSKSIASQSQRIQVDRRTGLQYVWKKGPSGRYAKVPVDEGRGFHHSQSSSSSSAQQQQQQQQPSKHHCRSHLRGRVVGHTTDELSKYTRSTVASSSCTTRSDGYYSCAGSFLSAGSGSARKASSSPNNSLLDTTSGHCRRSLNEMTEEEQLELALERSLQDSSTGGSHGQLRHGQRHGSGGGYFRYTNSVLPNNNSTAMTTRPSGDASRQREPKQVWKKDLNNIKYRKYRELGC